MDSRQHHWEPTGRTGFHCTPYPVRYLRCVKCKQNGYRIDPPVPGRSNDIIYTWRDDDPPEGMEGL